MTIGEPCTNKIWVDIAFLCGFGMMYVWYLITIRTERKKMIDDLKETRRK